MVTLYQVDSPINREQRNNINATFADILIRFTNLRYQISLLTGGEDLEETIRRIETAINNANNATSSTQEALNNITNALNELQTALDNSNAATQGANTATTEVRQEVVNLQNLINNLGNAETYLPTKTYEKNNVIEYNGNSYMAIQQTTGNLPPVLPEKRNDYWQLIAQRGIDGSGAVSTVNGLGPNVNGNVTLTPEDIGAAPSTITTRVDANKSDLIQRAINVKNPPDGLTAAVGNGTVNDQPAIQAIIDYADTNNYDVYFPSGTYRLDETIKRKGRVSLYGQGMMSTTLRFHKSTGGVILDTVNEPLHGVTINGIAFTKDASVTANVTGILGGSTLEKYNSAICTFERLRFENLFIGISGGGVPTGVGIFDSLFNDIFASNCTIGLQFDGSGNTVTHPRIVLCEIGFEYKHLNSESYAGINVNGGIFIQNNYDITVSDVNGLRPCSFNGTWFEQSVYGIINIPNADTRLMSFSFRDCMLSTNTENFGLLNFYNALGNITIDTCTIAQVNNSSIDIFNPFSENGSLEVRNSTKILNNGTRSSINYSKDSQWKTLELQNGWTNVDSTVTQYCKTGGNVVHLQIGMRNGAVTNGTIIGQLPNAYMPRQSVRFFVYDATNSNIVNMYVDSAGNIVISGNGYTTGVYAGYISFKVES